MQFAKGTQLLSDIDRIFSSRDNECLRRLTEYIVGHSDYGCFEQALELQQHPLYLFTAHSLPTALQEIGGPID